MINKNDKEVKITTENGKGKTSPYPLLTWKPFPVDALPEPLRGLVLAGASAMQCDAAYIALPLLAATASAVGLSRSVRLKKSWYEPCILWTATVGESGSVKSPAWKLATDPLARRQTKLFREHTDALKKYEVKKQRYEVDLASWKRSKDRTDDPPEKPQEPIPVRYIVGDTTCEALAPILESQPRGVLISRDELAGWIGSFDAYKTRVQSDAANWLSAWSAGSWTVDRKTGKRITHIPRAGVSICGTIQPGTLRSALGTLHLEDGLAARLLFAFPPQIPKRWSEDDVHENVLSAVDGLFDRLLSLEQTQNDYGEPEPVAMPLTHDAKCRFAEWSNQHNEKTNEETGAIRAALAKIEAYAARLALLTLLVSNSDARSVDLPAMEVGIVLAEWFANEARRVYAMFSENNEERTRRKIVELIQAKGGSITPRELKQSSRKFSSVEDAESVLNDLNKAGFGEWKIVSTKTNKKRVFELSTASTSTDSSKTRDSSEFVDVDNVDVTENTPRNTKHSSETEVVI